MLRTNETFLSYLEQLYDKQERKEDIIMKSFSKGTRILVQNEKPSKIMLINSGVTKCYFTEKSGKEFIIEFLGKGEIIGDIEFIRNTKCLCTIEAMTEVSLYAVSISYFKTLIKNDLIINNLLLNVFAERIVNTSERASYQQLHTTEYSLAKLLELQSKQEIEISKEDMAAYLGVTIRSLNRALKSLNEK